MLFGMPSLHPFTFLMFLLPFELAVRVVVVSAGAPETCNLACTPTCMCDDQGLLCRSITVINATVRDVHAQLARNEPAQCGCVLNTPCSVPVFECNIKRTSGSIFSVYFVRQSTEIAVVVLFDNLCAGIVEKEVAKSTQIDYS